MNKIIFISGKITGERIEHCLQKFASAERSISRKMKLGTKPQMDGSHDRTINPLYLPGIYFGIPHAEAMKICLEALKECTHIYMLKDWKDSPGARIEHEWAKNNGLEIIYEE